MIYKFSYFFKIINSLNYIRINNNLCRNLCHKLKPEKLMQADYTCKICNTRNSARFSAHSYTNGVVLSECKGCKNRHLIADNLGWFNDKKTNIEEILKEKGELIKKYNFTFEAIDNNK